jgi:ferredoxin-type protein NapH
MIVQQYRRWVQSLSLLLLHSSWGPAAQVKWLCNPVLSCHSCVLSWFACPIGVFIHYSGYHIFPFLAAGTVLLIGALIGRLLCGWVCPFGFVQDLLHKIPTPKFRLPPWTANTKYVILIATVFLIPWFWGESSRGVYCWYCPSAALQVTVPHVLGGGALSAASIIKLVLTAVILFFVVFVERGFCTLMCPIGALLAPMNKISLWIVKIPVTDCMSCGSCDDDCPTGIEPALRVEEGIPSNRHLDCIVCHECQPSCPQWEEDED